MDIFKDIYKISKLYVIFPLQDIFLKIPFVATVLIVTIFSIMFHKSLFFHIFVLMLG